MILMRIHAKRHSVIFGEDYFKRLVCILALLALTVLNVAYVAAQEQRPEGFGTYEGYTGPKYKGVETQSLYIPMRDGVKIAIDLMLPGDLPEGERIPAIIKSTRYWRAAELRPPLGWFQKPDDFQRFFTSNGYALIYVDARGSGASFGSRPYPWSPDEIADGGEIVDWIISQPWSNGKVGTIGISYSGTSAEFFAVLNHPAVRAVVPRFADHDVYRDIAFPGGIPLEAFIRDWAYFNSKLDNNEVPKHMGLKGRLFVRGVKPVDADRGRRMLKEAVKQHARNVDVYKLLLATTYRDDPGNEEGDTIDDFSPHKFMGDIERSGVGIYGWGSWFDAGQGDAAIRRFINYTNPQRTVIGAWTHGAWNHTSQYLPSDTPPDPNREEQWLDILRFFDYYLKGIDNGIMNTNVLIYYTMGEEKWKSTTVWPPAGSTTQRWYFDENNTLSIRAPESETGSDTCTVNFEATTGTTNRWHTQLFEDVVYADRAEQDRLLLTYTSPPLGEDMEVTGHPVITLCASSTHADGAFFVYLEDIDENGNVYYMTEGQLRAIHRRVSSEPPPYKMLVPYQSFERKDGAQLIPGEVAKITFGLHPTSVLVKKGHRIRVAIAGHDKDTFARIPEEGIPTITVARNRIHASYIDLPLLPRD